MNTLHDLSVTVPKMIKDAMLGKPQLLCMQQSDHRSSETADVNETIAEYQWNHHAKVLFPEKISSFRSVDASFQVQSISRRPSLNRKSRTLHSCPCSEQPMAHYDSLRSRSCEPKIWDMFWCSDADNTSRTSEAFSQTDAHCELTFVYFDYICDVVKSWIVIIWYNMI